MPSEIPSDRKNAALPNRTSSVFQRIDPPIRISDEDDGNCCVNSTKKLAFKLYITKNDFYFADISIIDQHIQFSRPSPHQKQLVFQRLEPSVDEIEIVDEPKQSVFDRLQPRDGLDQNWMTGTSILQKTTATDRGTVVWG